MVLHYCKPQQAVWTNSRVTGDLIYINTHVTSLLWLGTLRSTVSIYSYQQCNLILLHVLIVIKLNINGVQNQQSVPVACLKPMRWRYGHKSSFTGVDIYVDWLWDGILTCIQFALMGIHLVLAWQQFKFARHTKPSDSLFDKISCLG